MIITQQLFGMDIKPKFKWYEKILLYPLLVPYFASKELFKYVTETRTITPLHKAVTGKNHQDEVIRLIKSGENINAKDHSGRTPLHYAALNHREEMILLLLANGADINIQDDEKSTVMSYISFINDLSVLKAIIKFGGNIHETTDLTEDTVLHNFCASGKPNIVKFLLDIGAKKDLQKLNFRKESVLHKAVLSKSKEKLDVLKILIENGADKNVKNEKGESPLELAEKLMNDPFVDQRLTKLQIKYLRQK